MLETPNSRRNLDLAIQRSFGQNQNYLEVRTVMANAIVAQMLPSGAVKGGSAIKFRLGYSSTRFTSDLDTVFRTDLKAFIADYEEGLKNGWNGFTGRIVAKTPAEPKGVPAEYVMQPFEVKLSYNGKSWITVILEVGHNEIGDGDEPDWAMSSDVISIFEELGFPAPKPVALMPLSHQIAQKLHGLSEQGSKRVHDLIDLQLIVANADPNLRSTREICERLFEYRKKQKWHPTITIGNDWDALYSTQIESLAVLKSVDEAVSWANDLIRQIIAA